MAYRPRTYTESSTAGEAVNYDPDRTNLVLTNLSGETIYMGVDGSVAASGSNQGVPILNNGRFEANFMNGTDPRIARWIVGTAGGSVNIFEESAKQVDPVLDLLQGILTQLKKITCPNRK